MKRLTLVVLTVFSICAFAQSAFCTTGNISGYLGFRALDSDEWAPVETQLQIGAIFDITPVNWPVAIAVDLLVSVGVEDDYYLEGSWVDITASVVELDVGFRKIFNPGAPFKPYVGGGLAFASADYEVDYHFSYTQDDDDSGVGIWVGAGFYAQLSNHFHLGLDARFSSIDVTLFGQDVNAGGLQLGVIGGYDW